MTTLYDTQGRPLSIISGDTAHDAALPTVSRPVRIGGHSYSGAPTAVSAADEAVDAAFTLRGAQHSYLVDVNGAALLTAVQYVEDSALGTTPQGSLVVARRTDTLATLTPAVDDAASVRVNNRGALWVTHDGAIDTELPAAIALNDLVSNPTTPIVGAAGMLWRQSGSAWDMARGLTGDGMPITGVTATAPMHWNGTGLDRPRTVPALTGSVPNVDTGVTAVGVGPGYDRKLNPVGVAATSTANAVTLGVDGADVMTFLVTTIGTTPGSMVFELTGDDSTWATAGMVLKATSGADIRIEGAFVPAVGDAYQVRTTGARQIRYKVNAAYASGTATVKVTASSGVALVKGVDVGPAPHAFGYDELSAGAQYTSAQTGAVIGPTVTSTQRLVVTYVQIGTGGTVAGTQVSLYFGTTTTFTRGTSKTIFDHEFAPSATLKPGWSQAKPNGWRGAADEELRITNVGAINPLTITFWYYLVAA